MKIVKTKTQRSVWMLVVGAIALTFAVGLSLALTHLQVLAQPTAETMSALMDKTANTDVAAPGDTLTYTIIIEGDGTAYYPSLWMTDTLPGEVTYVPASLQQSGPGTAGYAGGQVTWSTSTFFGGTDRTVITYSVQVAPDSTAFQIQNTAELVGTGESTTDSWIVRLSTGLEPTALIYSPENGATVTEKDTLTISGVAWDAGIPRPFPGDPVLQPIDNFGGGGTYMVQWTEAVSATFYALEEADNSRFNDATTLSPGANTQYAIVGKDPGRYYYRVRAYNSEARPSRWSNVESVVVQTAQAGSAPASDLASALSAPAEVAASGPVTVWVRIDSGAWQAAATTLDAGGWWNWSYDWALPQEDGVQHTIHTQAEDVVGSISQIDTITVTVSNENILVYFPVMFRRWPPVPYPPTLYDINNADEDPNYTVSWAYDHTDPMIPAPSSFTLQESKDSVTDWVDVYSGGGTSKSFSGRENGTYYYRVRGHNIYGDGEWSETKSVVVNVFEYFDNFSNYQSGWPREWTKTRGALYRVHPNEHPQCPGSSCPYDGGNGYIIARRNGSNPTARFGPDVQVPSEDYEIELDARWWDAAYFATYQIFFGSDDDFDNYYALQVRINIVGDSRDCDYALIRHTSSSVSASDVGSVAGDKVLQDWTRSSKIRCSIGSDKEGSSFDHWKIRREDDDITIWINGDKLDTWTDDKFGANRYFGLGATLFEGFTPSKPEVDNWSVVLR